MMKGFTQMIKRQSILGIKRFRKDNIRDFCIKDISTFLVLEQIKMKYHVYNPQQNRLSKRRIGSIVEKCRALMLQSNTPKYLQGYAMMTRLVRIISTYMQVKILLENLEGPLTKRICAVVENT